MKLLILLFFISTGTFAQSVALPTSVLGMNEIISEFRDVYKTKITDLGKNYITVAADQFVLYKNVEKLNCLGVYQQPDSIVSSIKYSFQQVNNNELGERVIYTGCNGEISFIEDVFTKGDNLKPIGFNNIIKMQRDFELKDNETSRVYKVSNQEGDEVFKAVSEKQNNTLFESYYVFGNKFLTIFYEYTPTSTRAMFTYYGYSFDYKRKKSSWRQRFNLVPFQNSVYVDKKSNGQAIYLDDVNKRISLSNFLEVFNDVVLSGTVNVLREIFDYHTNYFPLTTVTKTGAQSQRLLEELRINQNRINNNIEINMVKTFIQNLINATEAGQIEDKRPKE